MKTNQTNQHSVMRRCAPGGSSWAVIKSYFKDGPLLETARDNSSSSSSSTQMHTHHPVSFDTQFQGKIPDLDAASSRRSTNKVGCASFACSFTRLNTSWSFDVSALAPFACLCLCLCVRANVSSAPRSWRLNGDFECFVSSALILHAAEKCVHLLPAGLWMCTHKLIIRC